MLRFHVVPSSSEYCVRLQTPSSCDTKVRLVSGSVNRNGSRLSNEVSRGDTLVHVAAAGEVESSSEMRMVSNPPWYRIWPVLQFTPIEGSAPSPPISGNVAW